MVSLPHNGDVLSQTMFIQEIECEIECGECDTNVHEREENLSELVLLGTRLESLLIEAVQCLVQVGLDPRRRLVGDLDARLTDDGGWQEHGDACA